MPGDWEVARSYRARWIFPVASPPIRDAVLEVDAAGRIVAIVESARTDAIDLGKAAIVPAFVNAHVHLEFSDFAEPIGPPRPFPEWIGNVVAARRARSGSVAEILTRGVTESIRGGTLAVGEIATQERPEYLGCAPGMLIAGFREVIGPLEQDWPDLVSHAREYLAERVENRNWIVGLSPHAPYTVPQGLFERLISVAMEYRSPVAVHLAETESERELLARGRGELVEMMRRIGLWDESLHPTGRTFGDWINRLASCERGLIIHGNYLDDGDLGQLAAAQNLYLIYCPRTHFYFGHPPHPFRKLLARGGRVALGTDGRSSNPDLSMWNEAVFLRKRHPELPSDTILEMVTRNGAAALGIEDRAGILAQGREANFLVVDYQEENGTPTLFGARDAIRRIYCQGMEFGRRDSH